MKTYSVSWTDPTGQDKRPFKQCFTLTEAKKLMKHKMVEGMENVSGSITKVWANGDWEPMGKIELKGSNKTFCANSRQKTKSYN